MNQWNRRTWGAIETWGSAEPELLLVPGAGGQAALFRAVVESLSVPAAAVDLPGHGAHAGALLTSIEQMAEAVESALRELPRPLVLLGHSMGGAVALEVALRRQVSVRGIILYSTGARLRVSPVIFEGLEQQGELRTRESARIFFGPGVADAVLDEYLALPDHPTSVQAITDFGAADRFDRMADLGEIAVPTLVIGGDSDVLTPGKYQAFLAERIPGARRVVLAGAGHMGHLERRDELVSAVEGFLATLG